MTALPLLFVAAALVAAGLASVAVWAPRRLFAKLLALGTAALFLPLAWGGLAELMSRPKPVGLEWWMSRSGDAEVVGSVAEEGHRLFLWLRLNGVEEPRAYVLPWSRKLAEQLQEAQRAAGEQQTGVRMRAPFEPSLDDLEPRFYAMPQPAPAPKEDGQPPAQAYTRPEADA